MNCGLMLLTTCRWAILSRCRRVDGPSLSRPTQIMSRLTSSDAHKCQHAYQAVCCGRWEQSRPTAHVGCIKSAADTLHCINGMMSVLCVREASARVGHLC